MVEGHQGAVRLNFQNAFVGVVKDGAQAQGFALFDHLDLHHFFGLSVGLPEGFLSCAEQSTGKSAALGVGAGLHAAQQGLAAVSKGLIHRRSPV